jgi:peptidoglycan/LPS O-acetylase OafA/YrhL
MVVSLVLEWRNRLVVAAVTAVLLSIGLHAKPIFSTGLHAMLGWLSRISYSVFLIHYPIVLIVGSIVARVWPESVPIHIAGLLLAWILSLAAGGLLYHRVEVVRSGTLKKNA